MGYKSVRRARRVRGRIYVTQRPKAKKAAAVLDLEKQVCANLLPPRRKPKLTAPPSSVVTGADSHLVLQHVRGCEPL